MLLIMMRDAELDRDQVCGRNRICILEKYAGES